MEVNITCARNKYKTKKAMEKSKLEKGVKLQVQNLGEKW